MDFHNHTAFVFVALIVGTDFLNLAWPSPLHFTLLIPFLIVAPLAQYLLTKGALFMFKNYN